MAPPANAAHIVYSGVMPGGEEFAFGYWVSYSGGGVSASEFQGVFGDLIDAQATALSGIANTCFSNDTRLTGADGYLYTGGSTKAAYQAHEDLNIAGTGAPSLPNQCAAVVTLLTGLPGRSQRGRMYLPLTATTGDTSRSFQMSNTRTQGVSQQAGALLNAGLVHGMTPAVVSPTKSAMVLIRTVRADSKIDTQRRRAEQVSAVSSITTVINTP